MQPYSLVFVLFVAALWCVHYVVGKSRLREHQWAVLLVGSLAFYAWADVRGLGFLLVTSVSTWLATRAMGALDARCAELYATASSRAEKKDIRQRFKKRKWCVTLLCLLFNFGILGYLKYWNVLLGYVGLSDGFLASQLLLPLGISFYTFTALGYLIDVYNVKAAPEKSYARFLLFVSWFPQLLQGPINQWQQTGERLCAHHAFDSLRSRRALLLILYGALKKYALADVLVGVISSCLDHIDYSTPGAVIVLGIVLYSLQQYGDFSGGIDIVEGVSELFGVEMATNFRQPYFSTSLAEFWRRWHMSLGEWMRAYVFYPLAMLPSMMRLNKWGAAHLGKTVGRTLSACISNVVVFLLVGLWHGAEAHYLLWGLYNGVVIAVSDLMRPLFERARAALRINADSASWRLWGIVRTFAIVNVGRYFDRLTDVSAMRMAFHNTLLNFQPSGVGTWLTVLHPTVYLKFALGFAGAACVIVLVVDILLECGIDVRGVVLSLPIRWRCLLYVGLGSLVAFSFAAAVSGGGFLYANF
ncbi:MAG: MBOAT family protein [Atopobiaceae bacterium]|nr:MBOAT family protein [Atopobiaceae bacterium]